MVGSKRGDQLPKKGWGEGAHLLRSEDDEALILTSAPTGIKTSFLFFPFLSFSFLTDMHYGKAMQTKDYALKKRYKNK